MEVSLKCQFCSLDFKSAYKMIPHVYFGHRKKISRQVRDQKRILLKCPAPSCDFQLSVPVEDSRPEVIFSTLAEMFQVLEDHIVTLHTNEDKLVECPYCSQDLTNCVYWVHLEEHMNSTSSPATPVSKPSGTEPTTPETKPSTPQVEAKADLISPPVKEESKPLLSQPQSTDSGNTEYTEYEDSKVQEIKIENVQVSPEDCRVTRSARNNKAQRSQILKNIQEIDKKIALKQKEESMKKLEGVNTVIKTEADVSDIKVEKNDNQQTETIQDLGATTEIQLKVEKQIEETILLNDSLNNQTKVPKVEIMNEEQSLLGEIAPTPADPVTKEDSSKKKVAVQDDNDERGETKKAQRSREVSGDGDTGDRRRSISGEKRKSRSVWNKEQGRSVVKMQGISTVVEPKSKPVLTEEMERNIIYGNFKVKDPSNRDDKLVAVKREIENRFKEEEEKRKRVIEEKRKAEEKEREKMRIADERLRKEREKLKEEKKKNKQRRKEHKEIEIEEENVTEDVSCEVDAADEIIPPKSSESRARSRSESPDQYKKIKLEISKMFKENEVESKEIRAEKRPLERDSQSPEPVMSKIGRTSGVVSYQVEEEEDEDDELEMMMRDFQERQSKQKVKPSEDSAPTDSLSLIQSSYNTEQKEEPAVEPPVIKQSLSCNLCKEEEGTSANYESAYQFLAHDFLSHRKKIVSASRKSREMKLSCPEDCGFVTPASSDGVSIDYFNSQLPGQLSSLCSHIRLQHTGEDEMENCGDCGQNLDFSKGGWQHLANHSDPRRVHCNSCNNFPFKNEEHRCSEVASITASHSEAPSEEVGHCPQPGLSNHWAQLKLCCPEDVETLLTKEGEDAADNSVDDEEDKIALLDMFIELALIDEDASRIQTLLDVGNNSYSIDTDLHFTKSGKVKLLASVKIDEQLFQEYGDSKKETFDNLLDSVRLNLNS